ncbi:MAG: class I SAM-dependent methyltransferase [Acidimicrobiia bacterium]
MKSDQASPAAPLVLESAACCICHSTDAAVPVAVGEDFEYRTSADQFVMFRCMRCDVLFLNPRPAQSELGRIYSDDYHAYDFSTERYGLTHRVRSRLEARRLSQWVGQLGPEARIIDIGAGDGFHLDLLRHLGSPSWELEAVEPDSRAVEILNRRGLTAHEGSIGQVGLPSDSYDFAMMIMVIEHVDDPGSLMSGAFDALKPGGRLGVVTDNIGSPDAHLGKSRHWGGFHFPRHFNLFSKRSLADLARKEGFEIDSLTTMMSPVNWTYTVHNFLDDWGAPAWVVDRFTLESPIALALFTGIDGVARVLGQGALLRGVFRKPGGSA